MNIHFEGSVYVYWVDLDGVDGPKGPFGSIAEIAQRWPVEFMAAYPGGLDVGQGGNVTHRISTILDK